MGSEINLLKAVIPVSGMTCGHCVAAVEKALEGLDGIGKVSVSLASGEVSIEYDPARVGMDKIREAISELGYTCAAP